VIAYALDWLNLLGRWLHLIAGIAWIGASFYFVWLNNHLESAGAALSARGVAGELWSVHGGAFYNAHKYKVSPETLPQTLHWFYWEAYTTFLSGFFLLCLMYYGHAEIYLIDPTVAALSKPAAIVIALAFLSGGWLVYDALCRSPLVAKPRALLTILAVFFSAVAWGLCHLFSGRGAYIQFGAILGSIMVANVFFVIIPGQRELVRAKQEGREPDPAAGLRGQLRSTHNTYFTLPVLFAMISNHYAMTYGASYNWLVLIAMSAAGVCIRIYFVNRHKARERGGRTSFVPAALALVILGVVGLALTPSPAATSLLPTRPDTFSRVQSIVAQRCATCHSATPTQPGFTAPPNGVMLDSPDHILMHVTKMQVQVAARTMPIGNLTGLTEEERAYLLAWMQSGAPH
jgi:uncharacterized membrane protein